MDQEISRDNLIYHVVRVAGRDVKDMKDFVEDWLKIMKHFDIKIINQAWEKIKLMSRNLYPDPYFDLSVWDRIASDLHYEAKKSTEMPIKQTYAQRDSDMASWSKNLQEWLSGLITREKYVKTAVETGQFNANDLNSYMNWVKKTGKKMSDFCKRTIDCPL